MKRIKNILLLIAVFSLATSFLFAEEREGLIPKIWKRFIRKEATQKAKSASEVKRKDLEEAKKSEAITEEEKKAHLESRKPRREMTKEELHEFIKETLDREEEILNFIPELKKEEDAQRYISYTYQGTRLENLDREDLDKLLNRVQNEAVRIRTERLNRQLESIRQAHQASIAAQQASRVPAPTVAPPPRPYTPPTPPSTTQTPKPPPAPPPTPTRR